MPVRSISRSCSSAIQRRPSVPARRSSSRSALYPVRIMPPSRMVGGGSSMTADSRRVTSGSKVRRTAARARSGEVSFSARAARREGRRAREVFKATRSRAFPEARLRRETARSMSRMSRRMSRTAARRAGSSWKAATRSWRWVMAARSRSGWRIHSRRRRAPIGVRVRSMAPRRLVPSGLRDSTSSRLVWVTASRRR